MKYDREEIISKNKLSDIISTKINVTRNGQEYQACCPFHEEKTPSFTISDSKGFYHCFGCGAHGTVIDFVMNYNGVRFKEACAILGGETSNECSAPKKKIIEKVDYYAGLKPTGSFDHELKAGEQTPDIYQPKTKKTSKYNPTYVHDYKDKDGKKIMSIIRIDIGKKKIILPIQEVHDADGVVKLAVMPIPENRPLYGMETVKPEGNIFIVEGEKTADALLKINPNANVVTWMNGTKSVGRSNWSTLPEDRNYILVPDADHKKDKKSGLLIPSNEQLGYVAMTEVAKTLPNPASVRMVNTSEMGKQKDGWDLADAQESGWDSAKLISFIKENIEIYKTDIVFDDSQDSSDIVVKVDNANKVVSYDDTYFKCLGFLEKSHYFFHKPTGQVWSFLGKDLSAKSNMIMLAPLAWWAVMFPKGRGDSSVDWDGVADWLLRINEKIGVYDPEKIRYRGAWIDEGRAVMHLGDKIICDDKKYKLDEFETDFIYPKRGKLWNDHGTFLPKEESRKLIEVCRMARWEKDHFGDILAGWMFASLVCGILKFRSHLYLIGASGSGKSWVFEQIVRKALGEVPLYCTSKTTEAGIRKNLRGDVRPVIFNESEAEDKFDKMRMQGVFDLARQATDEGSFGIQKGTGDGESYIVRSAFMFGSINKSVSRYADENRTIVISLGAMGKTASAEEKKLDSAKFKKLETEVENILTKEYISCLLGRAVAMMPIIRRNQEVFAEAGTGKMNRRQSDVFAMVFAGMYALEHDDVVTPEEAVKYVSKIELTTAVNEDEASQEMNALDKLLFHDITVEDETLRPRKIKIGKALDILISRDVDNNSHNGFNLLGLEIQLKEMGVLLERNKEGDHRVYFAGKKECVAAKAFANTMWESSWKEALIRLPNSKKEATKSYSRNIKTTGVSICLSAD